MLIVNVFEKNPEYYKVRCDCGNSETTTHVFMCSSCGRKARVKDIPFLMKKLFKIYFDVADYAPIKKINYLHKGHVRPYPRADDIDMFSGYRYGSSRSAGIWPDRNNND